MSAVGFPFTPFGVLQPRSRWTSVDQRLPDLFVNVLVLELPNKGYNYENKYDVFVAYREFSGKWVPHNPELELGEPEFSIRYWMPVPSIPLESEGNRVNILPNPNSPVSNEEDDVYTCEWCKWGGKKD